jgi:hypothetical protein
MLSDFVIGCKKWLYREGGLQAEGDDNRFQSEVIYESKATKAVVLIQVLQGDLRDQSTYFFV